MSVALDTTRKLRVNSPEPVDIASYASIGLWVAFLILCLGLILEGWKRIDEGEDSGIVPHDFWF